MTGIIQADQGHKVSGQVSVENLRVPGSVDDQWGLVAELTLEKRPKAQFSRQHSTSFCVHHCSICLIVRGSCQDVGVSNRQ